MKKTTHSVVEMPDVGTDEVQANTKIPADVSAKVDAAAAREDRTRAGQLRKIIKDWATAGK